MDMAEEFKLCESQISLDYSFLKENIKKGEKIIYQDLGRLTQSKLTEIIRLIEEVFVKNKEDYKTRKTISYMIIEGVQNVVSHSNKMPGNKSLDYILIIESNTCYKIHLTNLILNKNTEELTTYIDFLVESNYKYEDLLIDKVINSEIGKTKNGGIGLLTMINKVGKGYRYDVKKISTSYGLFSSEIDVKKIKHESN